MYLFIYNLFYNLIVYTQVVFSNKEETMFLTTNLLLVIYKSIMNQQAAAN